MGRAANGHRMNARRKKRYERLNPIYEERERMAAARIQHSIETQSGMSPDFEPPPVDAWQKSINVDKPKNKVHDANEIEADVEAFKRANNFPY